MNNLKITVSGKACTGSSYLVYEIRRLLRENGWNVDHNYDSKDNQTEIDLDKFLMIDLDKKIENVKSDAIITINQKQLSSSSCLI